MIFQSTPSARRATTYATNKDMVNAISIHALREEGDCAALEKQEPAKPISIHALREESDAALMA